MTEEDFIDELEEAVHYRDKVLDAAAKLVRAQDHFEYPGAFTDEELELRLNKATTKVVKQMRKYLAVVKRIDGARKKREKKADPKKPKKGKERGK